MADYILDLETLNTTSSNLENQKNSINNIIEKYENSSLTSSANGIAKITSKIKDNIKRLNNGYTNSNTWLSDYNSELTSLETSLASFSNESINIPIEFKGKFEDIFGKITMPAIKTGGDPNVNAKLGPSTSESGVLEYTIGKVPEAGVEAANIARLDSGTGGRATLLDIQVDGVSLGQDGSITIKKGQQVKLTVKMPDEIEGVQTCKRTSYDGGSGWNQFVSQQNDPMVNKNNPSTFKDTREYTWYITGNKTGSTTLSQTALFSLTGSHKYGTYKGMCRVKVNIVD